MEEELLSKVQKLLKDELRSALRDHQSTVESSIAAVVRSQAPTPVPQGPDIRQIQSQITQYLQQGHIVPAFQTVSHSHGPKNNTLRNAYAVFFS